MGSRFLGFFCKMYLDYGNDPKYLDPSYKMDLDFLDGFERGI